LLINTEDRLGVLLVHTGSPEAPTAAAVRPYLRAMLSDERVMDLAAPARWLLVNAVIAPFRAGRSAEAYRRIWTDAGSPLSVHAEALRAKLDHALPEMQIELAARYGAPPLDQALQRLADMNPAGVAVVPLYPQYAAASTGSALARVYQLAAKRWNVPPLTVLPPFFGETGFIEAWVAVARPALEEFRPDHVLLSYHGLPERHIRKADPTGRRCLETPDCCAELGPANRYCYRAQCFATTQALVTWLGLDEGKWSVSFQSRMGREPWLEPYTDAVVRRLPQEGVKRLAVLCPSFLFDCLETLDEIGIRTRKRFEEAGGEAFHLVPCLNSHPAWVDALGAMVRRVAHGVAQKDAGAQ